MSDDRTPRRVDLAEIAAQHFPGRDQRDPAVQLLGAFVEIAGALTLAPLLTDSARYALRVAGTVLGWRSCLSCERPSPDLDDEHACRVCRGDIDD